MRSLSLGSDLDDVLAISASTKVGSRSIAHNSLATGSGTLRSSEAYRCRVRVFSPKSRAIIFCPFLGHPCLFRRFSTTRVKVAASISLSTLLDFIPETASNCKLRSNLEPVNPTWDNTLPSMGFGDPKNVTPRHRKLINIGCITFGGSYRSLRP